MKIYEGRNLNNITGKNTTGNLELARQYDLIMIITQNLHIITFLHVVIKKINKKLMITKKEK